MEALAEGGSGRTGSHSEVSRVRWSIAVSLRSGKADRLLEACEDSLRPIVVTAIHTGMRKGELLASPGMPST